MKGKTVLQPNYFLSCDWGTTSFRLNLVDSESGISSCGISDSDGIKKIYAAWSREPGQPDRLEYYLEVLKNKITLLEEKSGKDLARIPVFISGMATSNIGLKELSYASLPLPVHLPDLETGVIKQRDAFPHNIILISGICSSQDVMRGEETQLIGLAEKYNLTDGLCILPGTHSKHIHIHNGKITTFKTFLTGELFEFLASKSILSNSISANTLSGPDGCEHFIKGIQKSLDENLLHSLFTIRAGDILYNTDAADNYNMLSGLLIGTEVKDLLGHSPENVILACEGHLQACYIAALKYLDIPHVADNSLSDLTLKGHNVLFRQFIGQAGPP